LTDLTLNILLYTQRGCLNSRPIPWRSHAFS